MDDLSLKTHYSVYELADLALITLPQAPKNILARVEKLGVKSRKRAGRGGGKEYELASLPKEVKNEIREKFALSVVKDKKPAKLPAVIQQDSTSLNEKQRQISDARMALVVYVLELEQAMPRSRAVNFLCAKAKSGELPNEIKSLIAIANAKANQSRTISPRTLTQWVGDYVKCKTPEQRLQALAPKQRKANQIEDLWWFPEFLAVYRNTNGISVVEAYELFKQQWQREFADQPLRLAMLPSIEQVRYALNKMPLHLKEIGRKTGSALRALNTYVKRDWSVLKANDVWVGDGHSMKMKVQHPDHGRPFTPELTLVMDAACRFIVGWSVSLSENALAVADAIRYGVERYGIPAIYYSDNGGGEKNWTLDGEITGILPRLGINHQTGIPGNPQGRGIIERVNRTLDARIARQFDTYYGSSADRETVRKVQTAVISLDKAQRNRNTELTAKQRWAKGKLPSWTRFIEAVEAAVAWYNHEHIHSEINMTPAQKRQQILREEDVVMITAVEARDLFRPTVWRVAQRGWISVFNNVYFHQKLLDVDGKKVQVGIDIHNPDNVIVRDKQGYFLCSAVLDGNKRAAFPVTFVEKTRQERAKRRMALKQDQVAEIQAELNPVIQLEHKEGADLLHQIRAKQIPPKKQDEEIALLPSELRYQQRKIAGAKS